MNQLSFDLVQTTPQGRKSETGKQSFNVASLHRSLKFGVRLPGFGFAPLRHCLNAVLFVAMVALICVTATGQEVEDVIKIKTRVVFLDALVKDMKTALPISTLNRDNFEVLDNGKPREISYFTREGQARKPLALILILDLREDGAGRFLKKPEILKSMLDELAKLPSGDEVAIMAMDIGEDEQAFWLTEFTNDRTKLAAALERIKALAEKTAETADEPRTMEKKTTVENVNAENVSPAPSASPTPADTNNPAEPKPDDIVSTEVITGKNGAVITRTITRDGTVNIKRVSKDGHVTVEINDLYDMSAAINNAARKAAETRPNSQVSVVWVSDGIAPIFFEDRDVTEQVLIRENIIFNSLTVELRTLFKFLLPIGKPLAGWLGVSLYGSAKYLAGRTGGEAVKVGRAKDYSAGLARIIGNLTARYSLGFALAENETDDGQMHTLEVRVKAKDEKKRNRKLLVSSRQGYYMSSFTPKDAAARAQ